MVLTSHGGFDYRIEFSEDFENWSLLEELANVNGSIQVVDPQAGSNQRYYRAVQIIE